MSAQGESGRLSAGRLALDIPGAWAGDVAFAGPASDAKGLRVMPWFDRWNRRIRSDLGWLAGLRIFAVTLVLWALATGYTWPDGLILGAGIAVTAETLLLVQLITPPEVPTRDWTDPALRTPIGEPRRLAAVALAVAGLVLIGSLDAI
jgi:hypothetical protein